jgi:Domain of unknown function (DUF4340)
MSRQRLLALVVIALLALGGASYLAGRRNSSADTQGALLFPTLAAQLNSVTEVTVLKASSTPAVSVHRQGEQWAVAERGNYPADVGKLRRLLLSLTDAKIIEEKTSNPASYSVIGVEDPLKPEAASVEVTLTSADGKHALIVGKSAPEGSYVRRAGEEKSYSVAPAISVDAEPRFWLDTKLLDLKTADIQKVDVKLAGGPSYLIHRPAVPAAPSAPAAAPPPPADFVLDGTPAGRKAADASSLAPSPTAYGNLSIDDVAQADGVDFSKGSVVTVTLNNGNTMTLNGVVVGDKHWIKVAATQDAALSAKVSGRAYEIANFRYDAIFRPLEQLLIPKPAPEDKKAAAASAKPHAQSSPSP